MNIECDECKMNNECVYKYKPTECANYRKFVSADLPEAGAKRSAYVQLSDVRELVEMVEAIPCICDKMYTDRKLTQPDCPRCNYIDIDIVNKVKAHF